MKTTKQLIVGLASLAVAASVYAQTNTYRTVAYFNGIAQGTNSITGHPEFQVVNFAGHNLVNLAMGRDITATNVPSQVLAMTFACDLSSASLVVYDLKTSNSVATIASSTTIDSVVQQDTNAKGPNRAHFVTVLQVVSNGNDTNGLAGGYLTVAGRVNLNPVTGCPLPVVVFLDHDALDRIDGDIEIPASEDRDIWGIQLRTGLAHAVGVVDAITDGNSNTILVPHAALSIHRELGAPATATN